MPIISGGAAFAKRISRRARPRHFPPSATSIHPSIVALITPAPLWPFVLFVPLVFNVGAAGPPRKKNLKFGLCTVYWLDQMQHAKPGREPVLSAPVILHKAVPTPPSAANACPRQIAAE